MRNKISFYTNFASAFFWCYSQLVCVGAILIAVFYFKDASQIKLNLESIVVILLFVLFPIVSIIHSFSTLCSCFSRIHISTDGLRCTVFGKEIKQIDWTEIKFCIALQTDRLHGTYIIYSTHDITPTIYNYAKKKWKLNI